MSTPTPEQDPLAEAEQVEPEQDPQAEAERFAVYDTVLLRYCSGVLTPAQAAAWDEAESDRYEVRRV